jgi:hypothetical protein
MRQHKIRQDNRMARAVGAAMLTGVASGASALSFEFGDGGEWLLDWDTNISYSAQWRVAKQDDDKFAYKNTGNLIADSERYSVLVNANDGNNNFNRSLVQNKISFVSEMDLQWRNYGVFLRGRGYYDDVYNDDTDHRQEDFRTYNSGELYPPGDAGFQEFPDETRDAHRDRLEMLDYYVYANGQLPGDRLFNVRLGSQVINWGEATFSPGINGLQSRADLIARNTPGVEVKEILLPSGALYGQFDLMPNLTFEAYYQYEWRKTELNGVGSYFSDRDFLGPGAENFLVAIGQNIIVQVPKANEEKADDDGQWGAALHWVTDNGTDFGFYVVNAHNKAPAYQLFTNAVGIPEYYEIQYYEDIKGYAASFTTVLGITNVQGEVSYKEDVPVVLLNGDPEEGDLISAQIGGNHVLEPTMLWDDANVTFEIAHASIDSHDSGELRYDDHASAVFVRLELSYLNVISGLDIKVPMFFQRGLDGSILETNIVEDASAFNIEIQGVYLNNFITKVGYSNFFDGGEDHLITDRDNIYLNVSYSF